MVSGMEAEGHNFYVITTEESPFSVSPESLSRPSPQPEPGLLPVSERGFRTERETLTWPFAAQQLQEKCREHSCLLVYRLCRS